MSITIKRRLSLLGIVGALVTTALAPATAAARHRTGCYPGSSAWVCQDRPN